MTHQTRLRQNAAALTVAALAATVAVGCASKSSHPSTPAGSTTTATSTGGSVADPSVSARVSVLQLVLDTGQPTDQPLGTDLMSNGIVVYNAGFQAWFGTGGNGTLSASSHTSLRDEAAKADAFISRVPSLSVTDAAQSLIASELLDAGLITTADLPGALDASGNVTAGAGVSSWYASHASQPLAKGSMVTLSKELDRIVTAIEKPQS